MCWSHNYSNLCNIKIHLGLIYAATKTLLKSDLNEIKLAYVACCADNKTAISDEKSDFNFIASLTGKRNHMQEYIHLPTREVVGFACSKAHWDNFLLLIHLKVIKSPVAKSRETGRQSNHHKCHVSWKIWNVEKLGTQSQGQHTIDHLEERDRERRPAPRFSSKDRKQLLSIRSTLKLFQRQHGKTTETRWRPHMGFTNGEITSWTELNWTWWLIR